MGVLLQKVCIQFVLKLVLKNNNKNLSLAAGAEKGLTKDAWDTLNVDGVVSDSEEVYRLVYFGGCEHEIRKDVWPFLLGHYSFGSTAEERATLDETSRHYYETTMSEWLAVEAIVRQRDKEKTACAVAKLSSESGSDQKAKQLDADNDMENDVFEENGYSDISDTEEERNDEKLSRENKSSTDSGNVPDSAEDDITSPPPPKANDEEIKIDDEPAESGQLKAEDLPNLNLEPEADVFKMASEEEIVSNKSSPSSSSYETVANDFVDLAEQIEEITMDEQEISISSPTTKQPHAVIVTDASIDIVNVQRIERTTSNEEDDNENLTPLQEEIAGQSSLDALQEPKSACVSPASSNGGIYSVGVF